MTVPPMALFPALVSWMHTHLQTQQDARVICTQGLEPAALPWGGGDNTAVCRFMPPERSLCPCGKAASRVSLTFVVGSG